jgi:hypothetical protein
VLYNDIICFIKTFIKSLVINKKLVISQLMTSLQRKGVGLSRLSGPSSLANHPIPRPIEGIFRLGIKGVGTPSPYSLGSILMRQVPVATLARWLPSKRQSTTRDAPCLQDIWKLVRVFNRAGILTLTSL